MTYVKGNQSARGHKAWNKGLRAINFVDITGQRFGKWTVLGLAPNCGPRHIKWLVKCDCGKGPFAVQGAPLRSGKSKQCRYHKAKSAPRPGTAMKKLFVIYRGAAKKRNLPWELSLERFHELTSSRCYYTGRYPNMVIRARGDEMYVYNGIDRLNSSRGYVEGNVVPCCRDANYAKMELSETEFLQLVREIAVHKNIL